MSSPTTFDIIILFTYSILPDKDNSVRVPQPAGIDEPMKDTPKIVAFPLTKNPADSASPPEIEDTVAPSILN